MEEGARRPSVPRTVVYDHEITLVAWKVAQLAASRRVHVLSLLTSPSPKLSPLAPTLGPLSPRCTASLGLPTTGS